jgi:hypothetical protein
MNAVALRAVPKVVAPVPANLAPRTFALLEEGELTISGARKSALHKLGVTFSYASSGLLPERAADVPDVTSRLYRLTEDAPLWRIWEQLSEEVVSGIPLSIAHVEALVKRKAKGQGAAKALSGEQDVVVFVLGTDRPVAVLLSYIGHWKGSVYRDARTAHRTLSRNTRLILPS